MCSLSSVFIWTLWLHLCSLLKCNALPLNQDCHQFSETDTLAWMNVSSLKQRLIQGVGQRRSHWHRSRWCRVWGHLYFPWCLEPSSAPMSHQANLVVDHPTSSQISSFPIWAEKSSPVFASLLTAPFSYSLSSLSSWWFSVFSFLKFWELEEKTTSSEHLPASVPQFLLADYKLLLL